MPDTNHTPAADDDLILRGRVRVNGPLKEVLLRHPPKARLMMMSVLAAFGAEVVHSPASLSAPPPDTTSPVKDSRWAHGVKKRIDTDSET